MLVDITLKITPKMIENAQNREKKAVAGHLGTHFDVMNKVFPLEYLERDAIVFDVSKVENRDIDIADIDIEKVQKDMFVAFYTGHIERYEYGTEEYSKGHPQLSDELIEALLDKKISIIGVDFGGIRRGNEHPIKDQYCADRGVFIVENLYGIGEILKYTDKCRISTYPMNYTQMSGLPCRVIAHI